MNAPATVTFPFWVVTLGVGFLVGLFIGLMFGTRKSS